jgi:hypothetical protein
MSSQQRILFQKPAYMKYNKGDGVLVPAYIFNTTMNVESITVFAEAGKTEITALMDGINDNKEWYIDILRSFVSVANQSFNKSYSADALAKHIKHSGLTTNTITTPTAIEYTPKLIMLAESAFTLVWTVQKEEKIDVPDLEAITTSVADISISQSKPIETNTEQMHSKQQVPQSTQLKAEKMNDLTRNSESSGLDELDADNIPSAEPADFTQAAGGSGAPVASAYRGSYTQSRHEDKRKLHEAQLRLKLAQYKAEKAIARYIEKYGDEDLTDFDSDESDFSSDEESED